MNMNFVPLEMAPRHDKQSSLSPEFLAVHNGFLSPGKFRLSQHVKTAINICGANLLLTDFPGAGVSEEFPGEGKVDIVVVVVVVVVSICPTYLFANNLMALMEVKVQTSTGKYGKFKLYMKKFPYKKSVLGLYQFGKEEFLTILGEPDHHQN